MLAATEIKCNGCGLCCEQLPCSFSKGRPCQFLFHNGEMYRCAIANRQNIKERLLIGKGCGSTFIPERKS